MVFAPWLPTLRFAQSLGLVLLASLGALQTAKAVEGQAEGQAGALSSKLYWTDSGTDTIRRANLDGSSVEDIVECGGGAEPRGIAIDELGGKVYWSERGTKRIRRANLDGSGVETVAATYRGPEGLALDTVDNKLYWTDVEGRVQRADLKSGIVEGIIEAAFMHREDIAVDPQSGRIFWPSVDRGFASIARANLDGSEEVELLDSHPPEDDKPGPHDLSGPKGIAVHSESGKIYWSDTITDHICRANQDGTGVERLVHGGLKSALGIAIDSAGGKLYWVDRGVSTITGDFDSVSRANLDGSDREVLITTGHAEPRSIAVIS